MNIPNGQMGPRKIDRIRVSARDSFIMRLRAISGHFRSYIPAGTHVSRLLRGDTLVMSDAPEEIMDHSDAVRRASGNVLVTGLGLGVVLQDLMRNPAVSHVTVLEISKDLIDLVGSFYKDKFGDKLTIVRGDAYTFRFRSGITFDFAWHDIWDTISEDNLPQMARLRRRYSKICKEQEFWCQAECRAQRRKMRQMRERVKLMREGREHGQGHS